MSLNVRVAAKTAALLHDPPHKAWIVLGEYKVPPGEGRAHEREALSLARRVLEGTQLQGTLEVWVSQLGSIVREADGLAASIDRALMDEDILRAVLGGKRIWGTAGVVNPFLPKVKYRHRPPKKEDVERFASELNEILGVARTEVDAYHLLYAMFEPLWWRIVGSVGPADTRIPHHTIFDHLYAAASMTNWSLSELGRPSGHLVLLDLAGVQEFVASARKVADYWAGSWIVSALCWFLVSEFIERLGPDILLSPTARLNPFYLSWVRSKIWGEIDRYFNNEEYPVWPGGVNWPRQPVMPATAYLCLPPDPPTGGQDLRSYFRRRYLDGWRIVVEKCASEIEQGLPAAYQVRPEIAREAGRLLRRIADNPPLRLRVISLDVNKAYEELLETVESSGGEGLARSLLFHYLFLRLRKSVSDWREMVRLGVGVGVDWLGAEEGVCTSCGALPAIVSTRVTKFGDQSDNTHIELSVGGRKDLKEAMTEREYAGRRGLHSILRPGEHLCPYCLVKRVLPRSGALRGVIDALLSVDVRSDELLRPPPSVDELACLEAKVTLLTKLSWEVSNKIHSTPLPVTSWFTLPSRLREAYEEVRQNSSVPLGVIDKLTYTPSQELFFNPEYSEALKQIFGGAWREISEKVCRYYSILRGDGNSVGRIFSGRPPSLDHGDLDSNLREYYRALLDPSVMRGITPEEAERLVEALTERLSSALRLVEGPDAVGPIVLSPSYWASVSRALMATALRDSAIVDKLSGVVVFAGGDDIVALLPARVFGDFPGVSALVETRRSYWAADRPIQGFHDAYGIAPAMLADGRKYGLRLAHYRDPMRGEIAEAEECERESKRWEILLRSSKVISGDCSTISYGRGVPERSTLPNSTRLEPSSVDPVAEESGRICVEIERNRLSSSLVSDAELEADRISQYRSVDEGAALRLAVRLVERNAVDEGAARDVAQALERLAPLKLRKSGEERWAPLETLRSARLILGSGR